MKRSKWVTLLSTLLVLCMVAQPVSAAGPKNNNGKNNKPNNSVEVRKEKEEKKEKPHKKEEKKEKPHEKEKKNKKDVEAEENTVVADSEEVMTLIEDETTVENGEMLRATTFNLMKASGTDATAATTVLKYFPVTLYDYDENTINYATQEVERSLNNGENPEEWQGIYFSGGTPHPNSIGSAVDKSGFVDGAQFYIQNARAAGNGAGSWLVGSPSAITSTANQSDATLWTLEANENGTFSLKATVTVDGTDQEMYLAVTEHGSNGDRMSQDKVNLNINAYQGSENYNIGEAEECVEISDAKYLCQWGGVSVTEYGGENNSGDTGNAMRFYRVDADEQVLVTIKTRTNSPYAEWNWWNKNSGDNNNGQKIYTGLVEQNLDAHKDIVFTKPDGGIFDDNAEVKDIYPGVDMPFVYEEGYYTFDASVNGVYLKADAEQKSTATASYETVENMLIKPRLYFDEGDPQGWTNMEANFGDGSATLWAPFNTEEINGQGDVDYHFGMRATIPFSMTPNGCVVATNDNSDPIKFSFSGDDDVWVFIDGHLVIDLGGIHNRLDAEIDFKKNTVTYSETNNINVETGSYNDADFTLSQTLFGNLIAQDRATFAATDNHELTIFYLERGQGSSNAKIRFNLPVNDTLVVTKEATRSWNEETESITPLTNEEQEIIDNIAFEFILHRSVDNGATFEPVVNTNYYLLNENNQIISNPTTGSDGKFELKNGQSAKFITTQMDSEDYDVIYYVQEIQEEGFTEPDYNYDGQSANGYWYKNATIDQKYTNASDIPEYEVYDGTGASGQVTVYGSSEAEDSLTFICSNFLDAKLPNPSARPVEDKIVIDYGLPVEIDVLKNDVFRGDSIELRSVTGEGLTVDSKSGEVKTEGNAPRYGNAVIENGKIKYTLNKQLSGVEVLNYLVEVKGTAIDEVTKIEYEAYEYAVATVYIIPATTMYYEENFTGLVTYTGSGWDSAYTVNPVYQNTLQEPGVVGTLDDSPYGSDVAYLNDSEDSNGTSRHASTKNSAVQFSYSFTGTGTSFFVRATNNTGYMRIAVTDADGNVIQSLYRDTVYLTENDATLYNIPVFTTDELEYGTYTVTVTVARENSKVGYHGDFWLDGIRVVEPLEEVEKVADTHANYSNYQKYLLATAAYATDAEKNMKNVTLRNKLLREADYDAEGTPVWSAGGNFVFFTDIDGEINTAEEYECIGPKEEVYLNKDQSVTFSLKNWDPNSNKIYLGMKAPFGNGTATVGTRTIDINNASDCYYDISKYGAVTTDSDGVRTATFTITATNGLISVTNIKVTGNAEFTIIQGSDIQGNNVEITENENGTDIDVSGSEAEGSDL